MRFVSSWTLMKTRILFSILLLFAAATVASDDKKSVDPWLPMAERIRVWDEVVSRELGLPLPLKEPKPYRIEPNQIEATFEKDGATWTIMGANAPIVNPTVYPKAWPVQGEGFEVLVVPEPITNYKILPFAENIENAVKSDTVSIMAARDSYEPASFVIRTGDAPLRDVEIEWDDLRAEVKDERGNISYSFLPKSLIDVRVVQCWYQAGATMRDTMHKLLTPELLLHDDDMVKVDYAGQINMIKNYKKIADSDELKPFSIPAKQNKQIWLTVYVTKDVRPGNYQGQLRIKSGMIMQQISLKIRVLPVALPPPMLEYALFYDGHLGDPNQPLIEAKANVKTKKQMKADLEDMIAHGLTNATVWHRVGNDKSQWGKDWARLQQVLDIRKEIGWGGKPLLYLDWATNFKNDLDSYQEKIKQIISLAKENSIKDVYIYGVDEKIGEELSALKPLYKTVHVAGAKNFVAGYLDQFIKYADSSIDLLVVHGPILPSVSDKCQLCAGSLQVAKAKQQGQKVYVYSNPHSGLEQAETYRQNYGVNLYFSGVDGTLNWIYQSAGNWNDHQFSGWNDWTRADIRSFIMAYPTVSEPIPTVQWEGWRQGVNDIRFLTLAQQRSGFDGHMLLDQPPSKQRKVILKFLGYD